MPIFLIWALLGAFAVGGAGLYVAHEAGWLDREPQVAAAPPPPAPLVSQPQQAAPPQTAPAPTFDLVRVEPTGDAVMAGRAAPLFTVEVLSNGAVISTTKADQGGDWAIVLDKPLKPGAHDLSLVAISADGALRQPSIERATVVVPEAGKGEVIAMISQPNQPSRVVQAPTVEPPAPAPTPVPAPAPVEVAKVEAPPAPAPAPAAPAAPVPEVVVELPALASAGTDLASSAPVLEPPAPVVAAAPAAPAVPVIELPPLASTGTDLALAPAVAPPAPPEPAKVEPVAVVNVEAVELEGTKLYIAGAANAGAAIRAYIDDAEWSETVANDGGRFLIVGERAFAPGTYRIRIDRLRADGSVAARAEVPFEVIPVAPAPVAAAPAPEPQPVAPAPAVTAEAPAPQIPASPTPANPTAAPETPAPAPAVAAAAPVEAAPVVAAAAPVAVVGVAPTIVAGADGRRIVIVKPGDNLWNIAQAAYGSGFRYTTIYRANRKQIRDPDWIYPGQVFRVPDRRPRS